MTFCTNSFSKAVTVTADRISCILGRRHAARHRDPYFQPFYPVSSIGHSHLARSAISTCVDFDFGSGLFILFHFNGSIQLGSMALEASTLRDPCLN